PVVPAERVDVLAFRPDRRSLLTVSSNTAQLWDVRTGLPAGPALRYPISIAAAVSPDGRTVLTGSTDGNGRLWDVATGRLLHTLPCPSGVHFVAFSPDGGTAVTGIRDRTV